MTTTSVGYDGSVDEIAWAKLSPNAGGSEYGVKGPGDWKVTAHPSTDKAVNIAAGTGWGHGVLDTSDTTVTVTCAALASGTRWDLITVKRDWQPPGGQTTFTKVTGTSTEQLPARDNNPGVEDEQPLALVKWVGGQTQPSKIIDLRVWSGNGGMVAKDKLALEYLERVGCAVTIENSQWQYVLDSNNSPVWVRIADAGAVALFATGNSIIGGSAAPDASFLMQAGTLLVVTDAQGYSRITFPKPFPNGLLSVVLTNGDSSVDRLAGKKTLVFSVAGSPWPIGEKDDVVFAVLRAAWDGSTNQAANTSVRVNWIAIGW
jgi:hypothetical protein